MSPGRRPQVDVPRPTSVAAAAAAAPPPLADWFLRWVDELKVRGVVLGLWFFGTVDLAVDQRVSHRLEDGDRGPLGLAPHLTFKRVVVHHLLR